MTLFDAEPDTWPVVLRVAKKGACRRDKAFAYRPARDREPVCAGCKVRVDCRTFDLGPGAAI